MKKNASILAFLLALVASAAAHAATSIEDFFRLPRYASMLISPDGQHIAALSPVKGRQNLVVLDVPPKEATALTAFDGKDVVWFRWIDSKRVLFSTGSLATRSDDYRGGALYAIDIDGGAVKQLAEGNGIDEKLVSGVSAIGHGLRIVRFLSADGEDFIAQEMTFDALGRQMGELVRINSRTGRRTNILVGKPDSAEEEGWVVDDHGIARAMIASGKGRTRIYYREGEGAPWRKLDDFDSQQPGWSPLALAEDGKTLYVSAYDGQDKAAIYRYDPATRKFGEVVARHPQVDLSNLVYDYSGKVVGVSYNADRFGVAFFDEGLARVQAAVDKSFPDTVNILSASRDRSRFVVTSISDRLPGTYYLFDVKKGRIEYLADASPWIDPKQMSPVKPVRYQARDGLEIPAYLTLPKGSDGKNLPLVVDVHGGPWVSGDGWWFDPEVQFLASHGYAVLQPEYRGTTRYGWKHYHSSFGQWGLAMQDDVTDGVKWAVAQGIADPKRVCIYGASYGGYAAMMGVAKDPDLYKCAVDYVGVTDLPLLLTATWSDFAYTDYLEYDSKKLVGDVDKDAKRLHDTSPDQLADRIKVPVLMAYGGADVRVPLEHGTRMKAALDKAGAKYEWMVMDGEGHGFRDPANQKTFYEAVAKFLDRNLGK
jgi:dipeptidyl aminopeptidase/acylaminoacyl peptidase